MAPRMRKPVSGSRTRQTKDVRDSGTKAATTSGRQGRVYGRVKDHQKAGVYRRLKEVREDKGWGLRETARKVTQAAVELGLWEPKPDKDMFQHTDVKRFEGSDKRKTPPRLDYVRCFARATDVPRKYLLGDDVPMSTLEELRTLYEDIKRDFGDRLAHPVTEEGGAPDELRNKVAKTLLLASGIPLPPQSPSLGRHRDDVLAEIYVEMQTLYWDAFFNRGFETDEQFLDAAMQLGRLIPSPVKLPTDGFLPAYDVSEDRLRRWWLLQAEALRVLLRPSEFGEKRMDLSRAPGGRSPLPWREYIRNRIDLAIPWDDENAIRAAASPVKTEEEQEEEAARAKRVSEKVRKREEIAEIESPEKRKRAEEDAYCERKREKEKRWARERSQTPEDSDMPRGEDEDA